MQIKHLPAPPLPSLHFGRHLTALHCRGGTDDKGRERQGKGEGHTYSEEDRRTVVCYQELGATAFT